MIGNTYVVGITGQAQSGKDTAVSNLIKFGDLVEGGKGLGKRYAFADQLKQFYAAARVVWGRNKKMLVMLPVDGAEDTYHRFLASLPTESMQRVLLFVDDMFSSDVRLAETPYRVESEAEKKIHRKNLIAVGMFFRELDPDFWVKTVERQIFLDTQSGDLPFAFISDVRFENERKVADYVVRVSRPGTIPVMKDGKLDPSEVFAVEGHYDEILPNDEDLVRYQSKVTNLLFRLIEKREWAIRLSDAADYAKWGAAQAQ